MKNLLLTIISILSIFLVTSCETNEYNAYVVSSELTAVPILDDETGQTAGQAYNGFAVLISEVKGGKAYFFVNISDPSLPQNIRRMDFYIPVEYMQKAYIEPIFVPAIISLDTIRINPMAGVRLFREGKRGVIARFYDEIGPMQFIQYLENGYTFLLGMNLVHVNEQDAQLIKYVD